VKIHNALPTHCVLVQNVQTNSHQIPKTRTSLVSQLQ